MTGAEIDKLIADGLDLYGAGNLDAALLAWEQALAVDPENPQANSYVDYVRMNYELLTAEVNGELDSGPFGIAGDEDEYTIEISEGEIGKDGDHQPPAFPDPADEGWMFEEEQVRTFDKSIVQPRGLYDDDDSGRHEFDPQPTEGFGAPQDIATPASFANQETVQRARDLGFVQATQPERPKRTSAVPPELKMTLRTPGDPIEPAAEPEPPLELDLAPELMPVVAETTTVDLIGSLPTPTPVVDPRQVTRDLPATFRAPAAADERDMPTNKLRALQKPDDPLVSAPTRELGIRPAPRQETVVDELDVGAPAMESKDDRTRRRITALFDRATDWSKAGELDKAVAAVDLALSEDPNSALAQKLIQRHRDTVQTVFQTFLGDLARQPQLARPLQELATAPISPRAAFLLSRVDGILTLDEILDVSGMPRLEAFRHLCQLYLRGILM